MKKHVVIVTGSCGRIGREVVKRLGEHFQIVGFELLSAFYASANEELVPVDISSDESVQQAFNHIRHFYGSRIASVVHLASYYSFSGAHPEKYDEITVKGTNRLLKALQNFQVEQFLFASSMLVHCPCKRGKKITEDFPLCPLWDYPKSKVSTEDLIRKNRGNIASVILRIAGVYDDMCHSIPISHQIQRIYEADVEGHFFPGNKHHGASFVHMDDVVNAICLAVQKRHNLPGETTLLIGESKTLSYDHLQRRISTLLTGKDFHTYRIPKSLARIGAFFQCHNPFGKKSFIQPWMIDLADQNFVLDISRANEVLGWTPEKDLESTLPKMIALLKESPELFYKTNQLE